MAAIEVLRTTESHAETAFALIEEFYEAVGVRHRDDRRALLSYVTDPQQGIWIAYCDGLPAGCIALRALPNMDAAGEVKRMYVRPAYRGRGVAAHLLSTLENFAIDHGFEWLYLDSLEDMHNAISLYTRSGFQPCQRYNDNTQASVFMRKPLPPPLTLREFQPGDEAAFCQLNEAWIEKYFKLEEKDRQTLRQPEKYILSKGGKIFMALRNGVAVGCCALIPMGTGEFELSKMGVDESERGRGIGRRLLQYVISEAAQRGITRLYLETNSILRNAIHLYEAVGFTHVPQERVTPSPYQRANVYMEMALAPRQRATRFSAAPRQTGK